MIRGIFRGSSFVGRPSVVSASAWAHYRLPVSCKRHEKASMQKVHVLNLERISAADRAKIEAVDPAVNLTDVKGWFDGEYRETWPAYSATHYLAPRSHRLGNPRGTRSAPGRRGYNSRRLAIPARSAGQSAKAQMVSSASRGRLQSAEGRSVGQRCDRDDHTRIGQYPGDGGICGGRYSALRQGLPARRHRS
jgi:hypothetical protein